MNVTSCEKKDNKTAELTVAVTTEEFDKALEESYRKSKNQISVPGFRKGKAPRKIIERMYGTSVFYNDALDIILPSVCGFGITESELKTVGYPKIQDVSFGDDKSATVIYTVELYPEVTVENYKGISAVKPSAVVEDSAVDSEIASVQLRNARIQAASRPAINGDTTIIDFEGFVDGKPFEGGKGENYELVLGSNSFIPGFEEKMQGMTVGEERDLDLEFPQEYQAKELAGKAAVFKVKLNELKEKILPELDDEFAKDVSEFDTLEEYKNSIREKLTAEKKEEAEKGFEDAVLTKLADTITTELPESMIEEFVDNQVDGFKRQLSQYGMEIGMYLNMMGTNEEGFRQSMRPNAEKQIKITLALEKIAEVEKIEPSDDEIEKYYEEASSRYGVELTVAKESIARESVVHELRLRAASKLVVDSAVAEEAPAEPAPEEAAPAKEPAKEKKTTKKAKTEEKPAAAEAEAGAAPAEEAPAEKKTAKKTAAKKAPAAEKKDE
ncbi:trigger factor [Sporobacter termitidis DSM 10068]|uniref:Trigger factor n=1 Tax=Sporobacter termitidis DSM 10068 TaxID=1123282 RepID=A0A1M5TKI9_9FIRM|nr:trigger factor [Sporobacter termitidis]SHH51198.1 trigger factor [Sporobacter termitidis DSM 10068]